MTSRLRIRRGPVAVWLLNAAMLAVACALAYGLRDAGVPAGGVHLPWLILVAGFAAAEACVLHVHLRSHRYSIALGEIPLVLGLLFATPVEVAAAWVAGSAVVVLAQRMPPVRVAFNLVQFALTALLSALALHLLAGGTEDRFALWVAAGAAVLAGSALASPALLAAMALSGEQVRLRAALPALSSDLVISAVNASLALGAASVVASDPWSLVFLLPPAGAIFVAYRAYQSERTKHGQLEFMYTAARTISRAGDPETGLAGVLAIANDHFRAEVAQVCVFGAGAAGRVVTVGPDQQLTRRLDLDEGVAGALRDLLCTEAGPRLVDPATVAAPLAAHLRAAGMTGAMVAPLAGDDGVVGAFFVANRVGVGQFASADLQLLSTLADHVGSVVGQDRLGRRIEQLRETQRELEHQAFHDPLTGLANRLLFADRVRHALARRSGTAAVIYIDLDDFKPINDQFGHEAGDLFLKAVAERLHITLRAADTPARLGGDEFAVLLVDVEPDHVPIVARRIMDAFAEPVALDERTLRPIHASLGVAMCAAGELDGDELIRNADAAMYASKHSGKRGMRMHGAAA